MEPDLPKPKPPRRQYTVQQLRERVSARHKATLSLLPREEAQEFVQEEYGANSGSALDFVTWLQGDATSSDTPVERIHRVADAKSGEESILETEPGSIPPRPR